LAFPLTAAAVGTTLLDGRLDPSQGLGFVVLLGAVVALSSHERRAARPAVAIGLQSVASTPPKMLAMLHPKRGSSSSSTRQKPAGTTQTLPLRRRVNDDRDNRHSGGGATESDD
jgi:hypothetical protein